MLEQLYLEHAHWCISRLVRYKQCDQAEAEDFFTEALLNLRERLLDGRLTYLSSVRNYLYTTCVNMHKESLYYANRAKTKEQEVSDHLWEADPNREERWIQEEQQEEQLQLTRRSFAQLDDSCQQLLTLFYVFHNSMEEIASKLGLKSRDVAKVKKGRCYQKWLKIVKEMQE